jgi:hypothetical protein
MLLTKKINIKLNKGNLGYYNRVMSKKFKIGDSIDVPIEKIPKSMYVNVNVLCDLCKVENVTSYELHIS